MRVPAPDRAGGGGGSSSRLRDPAWLYSLRLEVGGGVHDYQRPTRSSEEASKPPAHAAGARPAPSTHSAHASDSLSTKASLHSRPSHEVTLFTTAQRASRLTNSSPYRCRPRHHAMCPHHGLPPTYPTCSAAHPGRRDRLRGQRPWSVSVTTPPQPPGRQRKAGNAWPMGASHPGHAPYPQTLSAVGAHPELLGRKACLSVPLPVTPALSCIGQPEVTGRGSVGVSTCFTSLRLPQSSDAAL